MTALIFLIPQEEMKILGDVDDSTRVCSSILGYACIAFAFMILPILFSGLIVTYDSPKLSFMLRNVIGKDILINVK